MSTEAGRPHELTACLHWGKFADGARHDISVIEGGTLPKDGPKQKKK